MILVTGANGSVGSQVLARLSARGVAARALVRDSARAEALALLPHIEVVVGDLARPETLQAPLAGIERAMLISSADPAMLEVQSNFIEAARRAGVRHIVKLSGIMPELDSPFRFARMHGAIEERLAASGVGFTQLRAGGFMTTFFRQVPSILARSAVMLPMADARIAAVDIGDLADVAALALTESGHEGKIYPLTGPEALTMVEVAECLSVVAGKTIRYIDVSPEDAKKAQLAAGQSEYMVEAISELFGERRRGKEGQVSGVLPALLGRRATRFSEFAQRHAAIFRGEEPAPKV